MKALKTKWSCRVLAAVLGLLLVAGSITLQAPAAALAAQSDSLEITGDGVTNPIELSRVQLEGMQQYQHVYSVVNTWPSKKWYVGKGVKLRDLLALAGIKEDAKIIKFSSNDGYTMTMTTRELLTDNRYYFPHFKDNNSSDSDGNISGSTADAQLIEPIIALLSVEGSNNPNYMNDLNSLLLMTGQRAVTEQTGNLFIKYLHKIEVLTAAPAKWDDPQANPGSGEVPAGTMVALSNTHMDDDKIYYTTDGSTPTINSPMYNWIARRWWSSRADVLGIYNHPIGPINKDTIIKAVTIGPGKEDSDIVTFSYHVSGSGSTETNTPTATPAEDAKISGQTANLVDITGHWARKNIEEMVAAGAVAGYPDSTFKPDHTITRAEFATMLVKLFKLENKGGRPFGDTAMHWGKDYITTAASNGIATGYDPDTFGPDDLINREQMAVMIVRTAGLSKTAEADDFTDRGSISAWAREAIAAANENGVMNGYPDNTMRPQGNATRAEAVTVMVNALGKQPLK